MKSPKILYLLVLLTVLSFSCSPDNIDENIINSDREYNYVPQPKEIEIEILELINAHRISIGLNPLEDLSVVKAVAYTHTDYMIVTNQVSHDNYMERRSKLMNSAGALAVGENVGYGYATAEGLVNAWIESEGHRNVLEGDYTHFDISAEINENGRWYFTNIFIKK